MCSRRDLPPQQRENRLRTTADPGARPRFTFGDSNAHQYVAHQALAANRPDCRLLQTTQLLNARLLDEMQPASSTKLIFVSSPAIIRAAEKYIVGKASSKSRNSASRLLAKGGRSFSALASDQCDTVRAKLTVCRGRIRPPRNCGPRTAPEPESFHRLPGACRPDARSAA